MDLKVLTEGQRDGHLSNVKNIINTFPAISWKNDVIYLWYNSHGRKFMTWFIRKVILRPIIQLYINYFPFIINICSFDLFLFYFVSNITLILFFLLVKMLFCCLFFFLSIYFGFVSCATIYITTLFNSNRK